MYNELNLSDNEKVTYEQELSEMLDKEILDKYKAEFYEGLKWIEEYNP